MTTALLIALLAMSIRTSLPTIEKWSKMIDKSLEKQSQEFLDFRKSVFESLHQIKHDLGDDGFEQVV